MTFVTIVFSLVTLIFVCTPHPRRPVSNRLDIGLNWAPIQPHKTVCVTFCSADLLFSDLCTCFSLLSSSRSRSSQLISQQRQQTYFEEFPASPESSQYDSPQRHEYLPAWELYSFPRTQTLGYNETLHMCCTDPHHKGQTHSACMHVP